MRKNSYLIAVAAALILALSSQVLNAQSKWSVDLRPGVNFATRKLGGTELKTGFGAEGTLSYRFLPHLGAYAGWSWNTFAASQSIAGNNMDFEETGYCFGLQFVHPFSTGSRTSYMIKGGGTYNHIETEDKEGEIVNDTGHGMGWQLGVGMSLPISKRWNLVPEVRYRSLSRDMKIGGSTYDVDLNYISVGVGFSFSF